MVFGIEIQHIGYRPFRRSYQHAFLSGDPSRVIKVNILELSIAKRPLTDGYPFGSVSHKRSIEYPLGDDASLGQDCFRGEIGIAVNDGLTQHERVKGSDWTEAYKPL